MRACSSTLVSDEWNTPAGWKNAVYVTFNDATAYTRHRIRVEYREITGEAQLLLRWLEPGSSWATVPSWALFPRYGLQTTATTAQSPSPTAVTTTAYAQPEFGLPTSTTTDPAGLNLQTNLTYNTSDGGYLRRTDRQLPAGNRYGYSYYGITETRTPDSCGGFASPVGASQAGMLRYRHNPNPSNGTPTGRSEEYAYDSRGRPVASRRTSSDPWSCTVFDTRGRVSRRYVPAYGTEPARTITYNYAAGAPANPLVTTATDPAGTITTTTDLLGRIISYTDVWGQTTTTTYDRFGRVTATSGVQGSQTFGYDLAGRLTTQTLDGAVVAQPAYTAAGELDTVNYPSGSNNTGNGTRLSSIGRDTAGRTTSLTWLTPSGIPFASHSVVRDQAGRMTDETINTDTGPGGFVYDNAGRLVQAQAPSPGGTRTESYGFGTSGCWHPNAGRNTNRTTLAVTGQPTITYCYDWADRLTALSGDPNLAAVTYDTHDNTQTLQHPSNGNLNITLTHDGTGRHLASTQDGQTIRYLRDATDRLVAQTAPQTETTIRGTTSAATGAVGGVSLTVPIPVGTTSGDLLVAQVTSGGGSPASGPAGWTQLDARTTGTITASVWTRIAGAAESPATFTFPTLTNAGAGIISTTGINLATPISSWTFSQSSNTTSHTIPAASAALPNSRLLALYAIASPTSYTPPASMTTAWDPTSGHVTGANLRSLGTHQTLPSVGTTGPRTLTTGTPTNTIGHLLVVQPALQTQTTRFAHTGPGDRAAATLNSSNVILDRLVALPAGTLLSRQPTTSTWSYPSIRGDIIATTTQTPTSYQLFSWTPYGLPGAAMPDTTAASTIDYGWLGTHHRPTDTTLTTPLVLMGARTYHPALGRFLQTDPIEGGSANDYDYTDGDPMNGLDLDGTISCGGYGSQKLVRSWLRRTMKGGLQRANLRCGSAQWGYRHIVGRGHFGGVLNFDARRAIALTLRDGALRNNQTFGRKRHVYEATRSCVNRDTGQTLFSFRVRVSVNYKTNNIVSAYIVDPIMDRQVLTCSGIG